MILVEFINFMMLTMIYGLIIFNKISSLLGKLHFHLFLVLFEIEKVSIFIFIGV